MPREIKFRAWDKDNLVMRYSEKDGEDSGEGPIVWEFVFGHPQFLELCMINENQDMGYRAPNQVLMQYVGLKDCKGKEIYESDIIHGSGGNTYQILWQTDGYVCLDYKAWEHGYYDAYIPLSEIGQVGMGECSPTPCTPTAQFTNAEVIGNIYENKELLEANHGK